MAKPRARSSSKKQKNFTKEENIIPMIWGVGFVIFVVFIAGVYFSKEYHSHQITHKSAMLPHKITENTSKPLITKSKKPEFDFYTILPKEKVWIPKSAIATRSTAIAAAQKPTAYIVQVASFKDFSDADKLKAKLLLEGYPVNTNMKPDKSGWDRVFLGPYKTLQAAENAQVKIARTDKLNGLIIPLQDEV